MNVPDKSSGPAGKSPGKAAPAAGEDNDPPGFTRSRAESPRQSPADSNSPSPPAAEGRVRGSAGGAPLPAADSDSAPAGVDSHTAAAPTEHDESTDIATPHESLDVQAEGEVLTDVGLPAGEEKPRLPEKVKTLLVGKPRDLGDQSIYRHVSLVAFLAWVGLGADGLSSSLLRPGRGLRQPRRAPLPGGVSGAGDRRHGVHHLDLLQPHHRGVPQRRRRLPGGLEAAGTAGRASSRAARCWSTTC